MSKIIYKNSLVQNILQSNYYKESRYGLLPSMQSETNVGCVQYWEENRADNADYSMSSKKYGVDPRVTLVALFLQ